MFSGFVDLDNVLSPTESLRQRGIRKKLVIIVMETYEDCKTAVRTIGGLTREFEIRGGLRQGSALSPLLFAVVIYISSEHLRTANVWELLFAEELAIRQRRVTKRERCER